MLLRGDDGWDQDFDEMVDEEAEAAEKEIAELCTGTSCESVPATNLLQIKVYVPVSNNKTIINIVRKQ